jgi:transcriptional regulator NrdR family protein
MNCHSCRVCGSKVEVVDSRPIDMNGVMTIWRRKRCVSCRALYKTIEVDIEIAKQIYLD